MRRSGTGLAEEIAALGNLSREELSMRWQEAYGETAPKGIHRDLLVRSAAWHMQAKRLGGLSSGTRRALKAAIADVEQAMATKGMDADVAFEGGPLGKNQPSRSHRKQPAPGARLIRDWNGKRHVIDVTENGFVFEAKVYNSLTAIAHQITGAHWSGPRFFGL